MSTNGKSAGPQPDDHVIVLFGATGDLARRKLLPGLFHLHVAGLLPHEYRVIGSAPKSSALTDEEFRADARDAVTQFGITKPDDPAWPGFEHRLSFGTAEPGNASELQAAVQLAEKEIGCSPRRLFHLAIPPAAFASVAGMLGDSGLAEGATRVIIEKPFGTDLESARVLNRALHAVFDESQVFRIDHFLGKESVWTTSWPSGSRTGCSSRCGTAGTCGTCRSTCPKRCRSRAGPRSTTRPAPTGT